jgi:ferric-dicitrate binding protein FerR (iron transport regulator)
MGSRINFSLPDGTTGWLNSGSTLGYSIPFTTNRKIKLSGEAWFDVAHDAENPFEITSGKSTIKVFGTKFNLNAYPDEKYVEVALEEGKVSFSLPDFSSDVEMKPNERLVFRNDKIKIYRENVSKYGAWREGKLMFRSDPMAEVARRIERWYNVDIILVDKVLKDYVIRGTFQDDSVEDVLKYLSMTSPIKYKIIDRVEHEDGTIEKKKILIYAKHSINFNSN